MGEEETSGPTETVATAQRTLLAAGFEIIGGRRTPSHVELIAERSDLLGGRPRYLIAITDLESFPGREIDAISRDAAAEGQFPVFVSPNGGDGLFSLSDFLDLFGGPVPLCQRG